MMEAWHICLLRIMNKRIEYDWNSSKKEKK
jgi:hypothetical protein